MAIEVPPSNLRLYGQVLTGGECVADESNNR